MKKKDYAKYNNNVYSSYICMDWTFNGYIKVRNINNIK